MQCLPMSLLNHQRILNPELRSYYKVQVFIPKENLIDFKNKLSEAGLAEEGIINIVSLKPQEMDNSNRLRVPIRTLVN